MKLFVEQIANGNKTIASEWNDNEKGAKVAFHNLCRTLWNDAPTEKALVQISDENLNTWGGYREYIDKTGEDPEKVTGKLFVMKVANGNLDIDNITEWIPNRAGIKGAMVDYHGKCASAWNADDVITGDIKILNEALDNWQNKSDYIFHEQPELEPSE